VVVVVVVAVAVVVVVVIVVVVVVVVVVEVVAVVVQCGILWAVITLAFLISKLHIHEFIEYNVSRPKSLHTATFLL